MWPTQLSYAIFGFCLLPGTRNADARIVAERMRQKVTAMIILIGLKEFNITMTFGIAEFDNDTDSTSCINRPTKPCIRAKSAAKTA